MYKYYIQVIVDTPHKSRSSILFSGLQNCYDLLNSIQHRYTVIIFLLRQIRGELFCSWEKCDDDVNVSTG